MYSQALVEAAFDKPVGGLKFPTKYTHTFSLVPDQVIKLMEWFTDSFGDLTKRCTIQHIF